MDNKHFKQSSVIEICFAVKEDFFVGFINMAEGDGAIWICYSIHYTTLWQGTHIALQGVIVHSTVLQLVLSVPGES